MFGAMQTPPRCFLFMALFVQSAVPAAAATAALAAFFVPYHRIHDCSDNKSKYQKHYHSTHNDSLRLGVGLAYLYVLAELCSLTAFLEEQHIDHQSEYSKCKYETYDVCASGKELAELIYHK